MPTKTGIYYSYFSGGISQVGSPPLVLIHGAGGTHLHWPPELRRMEGVEVFGIDLPGHGRSEGQPEKSIEGYASRLTEWMDALGLNRAVLIGHSMGGGISLTLSMQAPERVAGMVLVGSGAKLRVHPQILSLTETEGSFQQAAELITTWAFSTHTGARIKELALSRMMEVPAHVMHADFQACDRFDMMDILSEIMVPTLVICGLQDQLTPAKFSRYLADQLPNATLELVEGAGHMVMLEKPEALVGPLRTFLKHL